MEIYIGYLRENNSILRNFLEKVRQNIEILCFNQVSPFKVHVNDSLLDKNKQMIKDFVAYIANNEEVLFIIYDFLKKQYEQYIQYRQDYYNEHQVWPEDDEKIENTIEIDHIIINDEKYFDNISKIYKIFENDIVSVCLEDVDVDIVSIEQKKKKILNWTLYLYKNYDSECFNYLFDLFNNDYVYTAFDNSESDYLKKVEYDYIEYHNANKFFRDNYYQQIYSNNDTTNNDNNNNNNNQPNTWTDKYGRIWHDCSIFEKNGKIYRNYDFNYNENIEFLITVSNKYAKYSSIGIANIGDSDIEKTNLGINTDFELNNITADKYGISTKKVRLAPFLTIDGINENGVCICMATRNSKKKSPTKETNIDSPYTVCALMIPRYILDYADTAENAIKMLMNLNIFCPYSKDYESEFSYYIADGTNSYIVDFVENRLVVKQLDNNDKHFMTNFNLLDKNGEFLDIFDNIGSVDYKKINDESGVERYNFIKNHTSDSKLMEKLYYTKLYTIEHILFEDDDPELPYPNPLYWWSEYVDGNKYKNNMLLEEYEKFVPIIEETKMKYNDRTRNGETKHTKHSVCYSNNSIETLKVQEDTTISI